MVFDWERLDTYDTRDQRTQAGRREDKPPTLSSAAIERAEATDYEDIQELLDAYEGERRRRRYRLKHNQLCESCATRPSETTTRVSIDRQPIAVCGHCRRERIRLTRAFGACGKAAPLRRDEAKPEKKTPQTPSKPLNPREVS